MASSSTASASAVANALLGRLVEGARLPQRPRSARHTRAVTSITHSGVPCALRAAHDAERGEDAVGGDAERAL
jgi:hypothetical protein